ncbi:hypothetical protein REPUB_Repub09cG0197300 [Reevesia pubescens]
MAAVCFLPFLSLLITLSLPTLRFSQSDVDTLIKLKKSLTRGDLNSWIPGSSPCLKKWVAVMCSGETIIGLHLAGLHLSGSVDVQALLSIPWLENHQLNKELFHMSNPGIQ